METVRENFITQNKETQSAITPSRAVEMLKEGNARFVENKRLGRDFHQQVELTAGGQYPFAAVLSCIDSRVPTEIVFDQGIGDVFNARVAGNFVNSDILGSLEYACKVAGAKAILVLGHTHCGAVKGTCDNVELGNITGMLANIKPAVEAISDETEDRTSNNPGFVQKVSDMNVRLTVAAIKEKSEVLREMYQNNEIAIIGGMYDVETGKVEFREL
ncbi:carbonic anhydrase family protein [Xanthovirga aplysinae]|uniref:carbonic anhydrase family protein n=1 Tax=Xanthovirga aplysinae TaxID=2529853 RepID=UPI0012BCB44D|nr:carbonic anhydrase family protein [Xanthovirga aplysinae]MTI32163.1 carbonic anhydrase [Xanthovirga aplysinae]